MNIIAKFVVERARLAWSLAFLTAVLVGLISATMGRDAHENKQIRQLETDAGRRSIELMSLTLNGNLMGSVSMLGLIDSEVKADALGKNTPNAARLSSTLESVGRLYDAEGIFVVAENGVVASSWDSSGKPSTGLNVKFRPYFQMAMQRKENVYAAVSLARGDRALYFTAPILGDISRNGKPIGAMVARTNLKKIDSLLTDKADIALLLSPQGVVFSSSRKEWIGLLLGKPSPERLKAIRELKQFGNMFENKEPVILPFSGTDGLQEIEGRRYAMASASVSWNDPSGDWKLILLEDLQRKVPLSEWLWLGILGAALVLALGTLLLKILRDQYAQSIAGLELSAYAQAQQQGAERKARLATATVRLQRANSLKELTHTFLLEMHEMFGALQGVLYVDRESSGRLSLAGSFACTGELPAEITPGEGLLGQCAIERRLQIVTTDTQAFSMIRSGLGESRPAALLMAPILLNETLLGVVEIALLRHPDADELIQFEELTSLLAMNVEIVARSSRTEALLSTTSAAEQLHAEQLIFQQVLVDTIPYPVFYKGPDSRFMGFNKAYEQTFGVKSEDLVGKRVLDLTYLPESDRLAYQAEDEAMIEKAGTIQREMRIPFADGELHDTIYFVSGFRRPDGSPGGLVGTFIDVSSLKNAERDQERLSDLERFHRLGLKREERILELKREINTLHASAGLPSPYATNLLETVGDHEAAPHPDYRISLADDQPLKLDKLVDLTELQSLFTAFCESVGIAAAIIDLEGKVLASARWQRACTNFHRVNPASCARCIESDTELALKLQDGTDFTLYTCKNGMTDAASPIILEGQHLANVFIGQFHLGAPDLEFFRKQAAQFAYPEADYLQAINEAPIMAEQRLPLILGFLTGFSRMISSMSLSRHRADLAQQILQEQAALLKRERIAALSLADDAQTVRYARPANSTELPA